MSTAVIPAPPSRAEQGPPEGIGEAAEVIGFDESVQSPDNWTGYWGLDRDDWGTEGSKKYEARQERESAALLDLVISGDEGAFQQNRGVSERTREQIKTPGDAAYELYLQLGPTNEMYGGQGLVLALAGRVYNDAVGSEVVDQASYETDFLSDKALQPGMLGRTAILISEIQPHSESETNKANFERRVNQGEPEKLIKVLDMLADAAEMPGGDQPVQHYLRRSTEVLANQLLKREDLDVGIRQQALNIKYDLSFTALSEMRDPVAGFGQYEGLFGDYMRDSMGIIDSDDIVNGQMLEVFVPMMARLGAFEMDSDEFDMSRVRVMHSSQRADAPHDGRGGLDSRSGRAKRSADVEIVYDGGVDSRRVQLKGDLIDHSREYDSRFVDVYHGRLEDVVKGFVRNPEVRATMLEAGSDPSGNSKGAWDRFAMHVMRAVAHKAAADYGEGDGPGLISGSNQLEKSYGINTADINDITEFLKEAYARDLYGSVGGQIQEVDPTPAGAAVH